MQLDTYESEVRGMVKTFYSYGNSNSTFICSNGIANEVNKIPTMLRFFERLGGFMRTL